jgi:proline dehydrogenase
MLGSARRRALYALATSDRLESLARRSGRSEDLAYHSAKRYVAGRDLAEAMATVQRLVGDGFAVTLDLFGEGVTDEQQAGEVVAGYREAAAALEDVDGDVDLEIVPSHLGLDLGLDVCRRIVDQIVEVLPSGATLQVSAEESYRTPQIMDLSVGLAESGVPVQATVQANLRRSPADVDRLAAAGAAIRLVKGAYLERREAAYPWGKPTDLAYIRLAQQVRSGVRVALATHDPVIREALLLAMPEATVEMLLGVRKDDARQLVQRGQRVRIYAPYGGDWFRYWMRRVAEAQGA